MQIEHIVCTSSFGVFFPARILAMSISDVEDEEEAGQDDSEHRQHGHQYQQPDRDHTWSDLHGYGVRGRIVIYIRTHNNDLCSDIVFLVFSLALICILHSKPSTRRSTLGDRAFPVAAARAWNSAITDQGCLLATDISAGD